MGTDPPQIRADGVETRVVLRELAGGDSSAAERLWPLVYDELHALAESHFRRLPGGHTLQPTALVHEAFLRLASQAEDSMNDRAHFMAIAAKAMRQILVDHARRRGAEKRGGAAARVSLIDVDVPRNNDDAFDVTAVHLAIERLTAMDTRKAMIVEMRFFGGLTTEETAIALGVSRTTVTEEWRFARAWMMHELEREVHP